MKIIKASAHILDDINGQDILKKIELIGRTCYKSTDKITEDSAEKFVANLLKRNHEAMIEHVSVTVKFVVDRAISHEIVRHRMASFAQESTRYCNYSKDKFEGEITVILPDYLEASKERYEKENAAVELSFWDWKLSKEASKYLLWKEAAETAEIEYTNMLSCGCKPEEARAVLPNSLKTELIMTANLREWRHFFKLRACNSTGNAHPQMLEVARPLLDEFKAKIPVIFDDLTY